MAALGSMVGSAPGVALGTALGAELEAELEAELGAALEVAPSRGMMASKKKSSPAQRRLLAAMRAGSLRRNKANLLFNGAGVCEGSQLQGFA